MKQHFTDDETNAILGVIIGILALIFLILNLNNLI